MWLLAVFIAIPIVEIALFIQVGGWIGLWPTLAIVIGTAIAGTALLRRQGLSALADLQSRIQVGADPREPMAHGAMLLVAGVLLLTPGFFTDTIGFTLLFPPIRLALMRWIGARMRVVDLDARGSGRRRRTADNVVEAEFEVLDETPPAGSRNASGNDRPRPGSPWIDGPGR